MTLVPTPNIKLQPKPPALQLADFIPAPLATFDDFGRISYRNKAWRIFFGDSAGQEGDHWWGVLPGSKQRLDFAKEWQEYNKTDACFERQIQIKSAINEDLVWHVVRVSPLPGFPRSWCISFFDIQGIKTELAMAEDAKNRALAILSHELKTPITAILGWVKLFRIRSPKIEPILESTLAAIERSAKSQATIVRDVLDLSRLRFNKLQLEVRMHDLAKELLEAVEIAGFAADEKNISWSVNGCDLPINVNFDHHRFRQVLLNLLNNAVQYTPTGGAIQINLSALDSRWLIIEIQDNGRGIPPARMSQVLAGLKAGECEKSDHSLGLGLGLAIANSIVELHGGHMEIHSDGEGLGTSLKIWLPSSL